MSGLRRLVVATSSSWLVLLFEIPSWTSLTAELFRFSDVSRRGQSRLSVMVALRNRFSTCSGTCGNKRKMCFHLNVICISIYMIIYWVCSSNNMKCLRYYLNLTFRLRQSWIDFLWGFELYFCIFNPCCRIFAFPPRKKYFKHCMNHRNLVPRTSSTGTLYIQ